MRTGFLPLFCSFVVGCVATSFCSAQQAAADTSFIPVARHKVVSDYTAAIQHQSRLYNGSDYVLYLSRDEEHPYFEIDDWALGSVIYWNELYENVPLMYDISVDQIITEHNRGNPIKLHAEKVQGFVINGNKFVRLERNNSNIQEGFYHQLYDGASVKVYSKHLKEYREKLDTKEVIPLYRETTRYYIMKDGNYLPVKSKGSIISAFADRKTEVKSFIRKNGIKVSRDKERSIVRIANHYDSLTD